MPKKSKKSKSKRQTLRHKYKVIRKVKEHARKVSKDAKKSGKKPKAPQVVQHCFPAPLSGAVFRTSSKLVALAVYVDFLPRVRSWRPSLTLLIALRCSLQDPGIPKQWPFKQELIQELEQKKALILEAEARKRQERKRARVSICKAVVLAAATSVALAKTSMAPALSQTSSEIRMC